MSGLHPPGTGTPVPRPLAVSTVAAAFDSLLAGPLLVAIGAAYDRPLDDVALVASGYFVAYGVTQLAWARASDHFGRVAVIRCGLLIGSLAAATAAVPGPLWLLIVARVVGASALAAVVPTSLTYVGERAAPAERVRAASPLVGAYAAGTALAAGVGGVLAAVGAWRTAFALSAAMLAASALVTSSMATDRAPSTGVTSVAQTLRTPWTARLLALGGLWGAVMLGGLALLVPAVTAQGHDRAIAGSCLALYGVSVVLVSRFVVRYLPRLGTPMALAAGGVLIALGFAVTATGGLAAAFVGAPVLAAGFTWCTPRSSAGP